MKNFIEKIEVKVIETLRKYADKFNIEADKFAHIICGFALTIISCFILGVQLGVIFTLLIFVLKEVYDMYKPNPSGFSQEDIKYDLYGLLGGLIIVAIFFTIF